MLRDGAQRLSTTRVAERAGVSVGTLYQYFPHKEALLYGALQAQLGRIASAVEEACRRGRGRTADEMAELVVSTFLGAKTERLEVTAALHHVALELDSTALMASMTERNVASTAELLTTAADARFQDLPAVARTMFSGICGSTRIVFERGATLPALEELRRELSLMCRSYLQAAGRVRTAD